MAHSLSRAKDVEKVFVKVNKTDASAIALLVGHGFVPIAYERHDVLAGAAVPHPAMVAASDKNVEQYGGLEFLTTFDPADLVEFVRSTILPRMPSRLHPCNRIEVRAYLSGLGRDLSDVERCTVVAARRGRIVGVADMLAEADQVWHHAFTFVEDADRGIAIAQRLRSMQSKDSRAYGWRQLVSTYDVRNRAISSINSKLGYIRRFTFATLVRVAD